MPSKPTGKKALLKRSRGVLMKLARKTYLRCSKRIFDDFTHRYKYKDFQKCGACGRKHKKCNSIKTRSVIIIPSLLTSQIPRKFILNINYFLTLIRDFASTEKSYTERLAELNTAQKRYIKRI
jgi:hypothetical protein